MSDSLTTQLMEGWKHKKRQHWEVDWATMSSSLVSMRSMVRGAGAPLELGWILLIFLEIDMIELRKLDSKIAILQFDKIEEKTIEKRPSE